MPDEQDLQELQEEKNVRASTMMTTLVLAVAAMFYVTALAMWYTGHFNAFGVVATVPSNPAGTAVSENAPAGSEAASTVGQSPPAPPPAQSGN